MVLPESVLEPESVFEEIELLVKAGFDNRASVYGWIIESMAEELGLEDSLVNATEPSPSLFHSLVDSIELAFQQWESQMANWPATPDCDKLDKAFASLEEQGVVTRQHCGITLDDGLDEIAHVFVVRREIGWRGNDGYCFYLWQDTIRAVEGDGLCLGFGTFKDPPLKHAEEVGWSIVRACEATGLSVEWDGSADTRICLPDVSWQKRVLNVGETDIEQFMES